MSLMAWHTERCPAVKVLLVSSCTSCRAAASASACCAGAMSARSQSSTSSAQALNAAGLSSFLRPRSLSSCEQYRFSQYGNSQLFGAGSE